MGLAEKYGLVRKIDTITFNDGRETKMLRPSGIELYDTAMFFKTLGEDVPAQHLATYLIQKFDTDGELSNCSLEEACAKLSLLSQEDINTIINWYTDSVKALKKETDVPLVKKN